MNNVLSVYKKLSANPFVNRVFHTGWQAAFGAFVASISGAHGDARAAVLVAAAAAAAAAKTAVVETLLKPAAPVA